MPVVESEGFCLGSYMKMHGPRISGKPKEIGFLHGPIDRVVTIGVIKDVLCRVFDSRKALSRTNLAFVASGMRFFFSATPLNVWGSGVRFKLLIS